MFQFQNFRRLEQFILIQFHTITHATDITYKKNGAGTNDGMSASKNERQCKSQPRRLSGEIELQNGIHSNKNGLNQAKMDSNQAKAAKQEYMLSEMKANEARMVGKWTPVKRRWTPTRKRRRPEWRNLKKR
jgi:hypothetical protein